MPTTIESQARTRAFARVIGPYVAIIATVTAVRMGTMEDMISAFFANFALVYTLGAFLLLLGLVVVAFHQIWSSAAAIVISLIGWLMVLRGIVLLAAPQLIQHAANAMLGATPAIRVGFSLAAVLGLWLTYVGWVAKPRP